MLHYATGTFNVAFSLQTQGNIDFMLAQMKQEVSPQNSNINSRALLTFSPSKIIAKLYLYVKN